MKWDEAAVEAAIRALPMRTDGMAPEVLEVVEMIQIGLWIGQANARSRARPATRSQTMAELKELCDLCRELYDHIENRMRSPALRLVEQTLKAGAEERARENRRPIYHPLLLTDQLKATFLAARTGWIGARRGDDLPQPQGQSRKPAAREVTSQCAIAFEAVTGKPAARKYDLHANSECGLFVKFLGEIFEALGIDAKPAGQAKLLMEKRPPKRR